ncbi:MAG: glycosyltransferase family 61 protein, partial [Limnospira indica BM01]
ILLTSYTYVNYYHWHVNILPIAFSLKDKINLGKLRVISSNLNHWQTRSLQVLGIDCSRVEQVGQTTLLCRSLIYSSHLYASSFPPSQLVKSMFDSLKKSGEKNAYKKGDRFPELILISREDSPNNRKLLNEDEVYKALAPLGFVKVVAGRLSYEQQIQTFARAKVIVAQHGAGLT